MGASILLAIFFKTWSGFNFGRLNDAGVRELVERWLGAARRMISPFIMRRRGGVLERYAGFSTRQISGRPIAPSQTDGGSPIHYGILE
jgi:hypothetical protein